MQTGGSQYFNYCRKDCLVLYNLNFGTMGCVGIERNSESEKEDRREEIERSFKIRLLSSGQVVRGPNCESEYQEKGV